MSIPKERPAVTPAESKRVYNRDAKDFAAVAPTLLWWEALGKPTYKLRLQEICNPSTRLLDLGTASARVPIFLCETFGVQPSNVTGIEISPEQVAIARQRLPGADIRCGDITDLTLDIPIGAYDLATSNMVFEFLDPPGLERALVLAHRSLKTGGNLFFITTHPEKMRMDSGLTEPGPFTIAFPWGGSGPNFFRTTEDFAEALQKAGFVIDSTEGLKIPPEARSLDPEKFDAFVKYPFIRLGVFAHKP